jgi:hypothetical protein
MEIKIISDEGKFLFGVDHIYRMYRIQKEGNENMIAIKDQIIYGDKFWDGKVRCLKVTNWNDIKYKKRPSYIDYKYV